jgi:hypothetical protein
MAIYARTTPNDNFAFFDPKADFVRIDIRHLRQNDSVFYRVEKQNGRAVVFDGQTQYMWIPNALYTKGPRAANFLENFVNLLSPERLLTMQKSAFEFSKKNEVVRTENDSTITLIFKGTEKNNDLKQLLETGKMGDCEVEVENVFTKNDGLLRFVKLWIVDRGQKTLLLHIDNIQYNVMMSRANLTQIPDAQWTDVTEVTQDTANDRLSKLQNETATQATERILQAIISCDYTQASEALVYYKTVLPTLSEKMKGCKVADFKERHDDLPLYRHYSPDLYPKYDNFDAIEVSKTEDIPDDYFDMMGVPVTFLDKYNPDQFEILGITKTWFGMATKTYGEQIQVDKSGKESKVTKLNDGAVLEIDKLPIGKTFYKVDGKMYIQTYPRILIRRKTNSTNI